MRSGMSAHTLILGLAAATFGAPPSADDRCETTFRCDRGICWVTVCGGDFNMGSPASDPLRNNDEQPVHRVSVPTFEIMQTEITNAQYRKCVAAGACSQAPAGDLPQHCNTTNPYLPRVCLDYDMATNFCAWAGGRLPSESEWEFAARSRGQADRPYPWGKEPPNCERAVVRCPKESLVCSDPDKVAPVCSRPAGHTEQGLCDMAGNAFEWVADWQHHSYRKHPTDGSAWTEHASPKWRLMRGGGIGSCADVRTTNRTWHEPEFFYGGMGARCARSYKEQLEPGSGPTKTE